MKIVREFQIYVINKISNYFDKRLKLANNEKCENYINNIIDTYIRIDNKRIDSFLFLDEKELFLKVNKDAKIVSINILKIKNELMKTILCCLKKKKADIFEEGKPLFKEFIKSFGPQRIDENDEEEIDSNIYNIINIMRGIMDYEMDFAFDKFSPKYFMDSFEIELENRFKDYTYDEKKENIKNCKDFIIEPIAKNFNNYGILTLFFKFSLIVQKICVDKKAANFEIVIKKIKDIFENPSNKSFIKEMKKNNTEINIEMYNRLQNNHILITFLYCNKKLILEESLYTTVEDLIKKFLNELNASDDKFNFKEYSINDQFPIDPNSKLTLKELDINGDIKIMVY
jgi:hypothetical protein